MSIFGRSKREKVMEEELKRIQKELEEAKVIIEDHEKRLSELEIVVSSLNFKMTDIEILIEQYELTPEEMCEIIKEMKNQLVKIPTIEQKLKALHMEIVKKDKEKRNHTKPYTKPNKPQQKSEPIIDEDNYTEEIKKLINQHKTKNKVSDPQKTYIKNIIKQYRTASYQGSYEDVIYANVFLDIWAPVINRVRRPEQAFDMQMALNNIYDNKMNRGEC